MRESEKEFEKDLEIIPKEALPSKLIFDESKFEDYPRNEIGCADSCCFKGKRREIK
jgi:hypothetical protein